MQKILSIFIYISVFFPYTMFFGIGVSGNLQPYAFIIALIYILTNYKAIKFNISSLLLLISVILAVAIFSVETILYLNLDNLKNPDLYSSVQSVYFYVCGFVYFVTFTHLIYNHGINMKYVKIIFLIWTLVAFLQLTVDKELFTGWMNKLIISEDRGVISLSSEPSYYARVMILFSIIFYVKKEMKLFWLAVLENIFFARSLLGIFYMLIAIIIIYKKLSLKLALLLASIMIFFLVYPFLSGFDNIRVIYLLNEILNDPYEVLIERNSINFRLADVFFGIKGFKFIPNGFIPWEDYLLKNLSYSQFFLYPLPHESLRLKGMLPQILYELGIFSVFILASLYNMFKGWRYRFLIFFFTIMTFGFTNPLYVFVLAFLSIEDNREWKLNNHDKEEIK